MSSELSEFADDSYVEIEQSGESSSGLDYYGQTEILGRPPLEFNKNLTPEHRLSEGTK